MSASTRKLMLFIGIFAMISSVSALIYKTVYHVDLPWFIIIGGIISGLVLTYLVRSYDADDDYMPKNKK